jgi:hypothetical protein
MNEKLQYTINLAPSTTTIFLIFLVLKLTGYISWSWWWVTAPLWIPFLLILGILILVGLVGLGFAAVFLYKVLYK